MRLIATLIIAAALLASPHVHATDQAVLCKVVGVSDGDTMTCLTDEKRQIKVRLAQVDAPESGQPYGRKAKQALSNMVFGKRVMLIRRDTDRYGRMVATVMLDSKDINLSLVEMGMAWVYARYATDPAYFEAQRLAKARRMGLWAEKHPVKPEDWRRGSVRQGLAAQSPRHDGGNRCAGKSTCAQMVSCDEAKFYLAVCGVSRLDRDGDGIPCESLCRP